MGPNLAVPLDAPGPAKQEGSPHGAVGRMRETPSPASPRRVVGPWEVRPHIQALTSGGSLGLGMRGGRRESGVGEWGEQDPASPHQVLRLLMFLAISEEFTDTRRAFPFYLNLQVDIFTLKLC